MHFTKTQFWIDSSFPFCGPLSSAVALFSFPSSILHMGTAWPYSLDFYSFSLLAVFSIRSCGLVSLSVSSLEFVGLPWICELMGLVNSHANWPLSLQKIFLFPSLFLFLILDTDVSLADFVYGSVTCYLPQTGGNWGRLLPFSHGLS